MTVGGEFPLSAIMLFHIFQEYKHKIFAYVPIFSSRHALRHLKANRGNCGGGG